MYFSLKWKIGQNERLVVVHHKTQLWSMSSLALFVLEVKPLYIFLIEKRTKNRNGTGLDLSLGERLTWLSKRLSRNRCCDTTPDRCQEGSRLTILLRIV